METNGAESIKRKSEVEGDQVDAPADSSEAVVAKKAKVEEEAEPAKEEAAPPAEATA